MAPDEKDPLDRDEYVGLGDLLWRFAQAELDDVRRL